MWRDAAGVRFVGKLELGDDGLDLDGSAGDGAAAHVRIPYEDLAGVRVGRTPAERLTGRPSLLLDVHAGGTVAVGPVGGPGVAPELGEELAELIGLAARATRATVVAPLKPGMGERARRLIAEGPPFDLSATSLERHAVFVTDGEAVFVFEGPDVRALAAHLVRTPAAWRAAVAWQRCLAGRPRLAEEVDAPDDSAGRAPLRP